MPTTLLAVSVLALNGYVHYRTNWTKSRTLVLRFRLDLWPSPNLSPLGNTDHELAGLAHSVTDGVNRLLPRDRTEPRPHAQAAFGVGPGLIRRFIAGSPRRSCYGVYPPQQATEPLLPLGYDEFENAKCIFVPHYNV